MFTIKLSSNSIEITASDEKEFDLALTKVESVADKANDIGINLKVIAPIAKTNARMGPHETAFTQKHGDARISKRMIETFKLPHEREKQFAKLLKLLRSGEIKKTGKGYMSNLDSAGMTLAKRKKFLKAMEDFDPNIVV
ncbi:MAG: hypothetical protein WCD79_08025 [Chthoniobacteraceae bacterium]